MNEAKRFLLLCCPPEGETSELGEGRSLNSFAASCSASVMEVPSVRPNEELARFRPLLAGPLAPAV
jgi:hypothetical protein